MPINQSGMNQPGSDQPDMDQPSMDSAFREPSTDSRSATMNADAAAARAPLPDAPRRTLAARLLPAHLQPYAQLARLDRPIGWWLLLLPCWWSAALAGVAVGRPPNLLHLVLFLLGAVAMRGAGSTWNDILDRDLDAQVERTRARPLPSGSVGLAGAAVFLVLQACVGLLVLLCFDEFSIWLGMTALLPVIVYPLVKRFTNYPQIVLGLAFSWGALMGWAAVFGSLGLAPLLLYGAAIFWTVGYDTIYALQDIEDDAIVGIGSTARAHGPRVNRFVALCYLGAVLLLTLALLAVDARLPSWIGLGLFALHLGWQVARIRPDDPPRALALFRSNRDAGLVLFAGLALDAVGRWMHVI